MYKFFMFFLLPIFGVMCLVGSFTFKTNAAELAPLGADLWGEIATQSLAQYFIYNNVFPGTLEELRNQSTEIVPYNTNAQLTVIESLTPDNKLSIAFANSEFTDYGAYLNYIFSTDSFTGYDYDTVNNDFDFGYYNFYGTDVYTVLDPTTHLPLTNTKPVNFNIKNFSIPDVSNYEVVNPNANFNFGISSTGVIQFVNRNNGRTYTVSTSSKTPIYFYYLSRVNPSNPNTFNWGDLCAFSFSPFSDYSNYYTYQLPNGTTVYNMLANVEVLGEQKNLIAQDYSSQASVFNDLFSPFVSQHYDLFGLGNGQSVPQYSKMFRYIMNDVPIAEQLANNDIFDIQAQDKILSYDDTQELATRLGDEVFSYGLAQGLGVDVIGELKEWLERLPVPEADPDPTPDPDLDPDPDPDPDPTPDPTPDPDSPVPEVIIDIFDNFHGLDIFEPIFHIVPNSVQGSLLYQVWLLIPTIALVIVVAYIIINVF